MIDYGPARLRGDRDESTIDPVAREVVRRLIEDATQPVPPTEADEVILDFEIAGIRYLAVRCGRQTVPGPAPEMDSYGSRPELGPALSPREFEIARMVAKGYANKTIASILEISSWTVSSHLRRIFTKLGVTSRAAMVARLLDDHRHGGAPCPAAAGDPPPVRMQQPRRDTSGLTGLGTAGLVS